MQRLQADRGFSAWQLVLIFLGAVAVCAVFFSLGFVVGYNNKPAKTAGTATENVAASSSSIPPTVNAPPDSPSDLSKETVAPDSAPPAPLAQPISTPPPAPVSPLVPAPQVSRKLEKAPAPSTRRQHKLARTGTMSEPAAGSGRNVRFGVQVMASRNKADAITLIKLLQARSYHVFLVSPKHSRAGDRLYRVQVGPYNSRSEADRVRHRLEREGFKPFVVH